ncbi:hypothetical protein BAE44_0016622 [Dichanthelium oligosanthes]|uniref:Uncharacterized protein n=1 Tax=Dichanthelium oligosanthes TaxID=888268 RepID=A0A1E5VB42_9POAL|nr:hypothetical protein BAE44_0016622 [Dichanthelium oligosanthes]
MLRIRKCILSHLYPSPPYAAPISPPFSLHRLSATAPPFVAEDYLVANCDLSREKALKVKASKKLSRLKSSSGPDAVIAFLGGLGLSRAEVARLVANDPRLLCADVDKTLAPRVDKLGDLGLSRPEIGRLVLASRNQFRSNWFLRKVELGRRISGSLDELHQVVNLPNRQLLRKLEFWHKISGFCANLSDFLSIDLEKVAIPKLTLLQQRGITVSDLPPSTARSLMTKSAEQLINGLACIDEFGIQQSSPVFFDALVIFATISSEMLTNNIQLFENLGWSKNDISLAVSQAPGIICLGEKRLRRSLDFLMGEVGLEIPYIAQQPALILYNTECRLLPRHCLMKFLKAKGLLKCDLSFDLIAKMREQKFLNRFLHPYEESVPGLAAVYASSRAGKHQWEQLNEAPFGRSAPAPDSAL